MSNIGQLISSYKPGYWIKAKSKRIPKIEWFVTDAIFDEITRNRMILKAQLEIPTDRQNPSISIIINLHDFKSDWDLYVYYKDKIVTLPVIDIKVDDRQKVVYLITE
jgi:hypothetical protein